MKYYLLKELSGIRTPDIFNYNKVINYQAFVENQPYKISKRTICVIENEVEYGDILFTPFPLFSDSAKEALDLFLWECQCKEYEFINHDRSESYHYYLPFFRRHQGQYYEYQGEDGIYYADITINQLIPDDIPIIYLETGSELLMIARLDLVESLLRRGICSAKLIPIISDIGGMAI